MCPFEIRTNACMFRWKILSADAAAEQDDYNREIGAKTAKDMEKWLRSLQEVGCGGLSGWYYRVRLEYFFSLAQTA